MEVQQIKVVEKFLRKIYNTDSSDIMANICEIEGEWIIKIGRGYCLQSITSQPYIASSYPDGDERVISIIVSKIAGDYERGISILNAYFIVASLSTRQFANDDIENNVKKIKQKLAPLAAYYIADEWSN